MQGDNELKVPLETPPKRLGFTTPVLFHEMMKVAALIFSDSKDFKNQLYTKAMLIILAINCDNAELCTLLFDEKLGTKWEFPSEVPQLQRRTAMANKTDLFPKGQSRFCARQGIDPAEDVSRPIVRLIGHLLKEKCEERLCSRPLHVRSL